MAVVDLRFTAVPPSVQQQIRNRIHQTLLKEGYQVISEATAASRLKQVSIPPGCTVGPCLVQVGHALKVDRVVMGGVAGQGSSYDITLTLLETRGGTVLAQTNHRCDVCSFKEVEDATAVASERLHRQSLVFLSKRAILVVHSQPTGADILLDGLPSGRTPSRFILNPGVHTLEVATRGHSAVTQQLQLEMGRTHTVRVTLIPKLTESLIDSKRPRQAHRAPGWIKWVVLGTGVVVGGVGGGLLAMDGRETSDPRYVHDTRMAGVTLISLGAATAVAGILMSLVDLATRPPEHKSAARDHLP